MIFSYDKKGKLVSEAKLGRDYNYVCESDILLFCSTHTEHMATCFGCFGDPEMSEKVKAKETFWFACDYCQIWYHSYCHTRNKYLFEQEPNKSNSLSQKDLNEATDEL